ncbi:MAG: SDR family oxidoreductase [SAR202 cluster bacterium]|jgi:NAD(P)-dependent dehydrogenase (short-subunit alcohol dehydrogenase family)|nr:SDR family oxidoreductase [SAR202 cluster bacterium]
MSRKLEGKVALVTGASKGIGQGLAIGLAAAGAHIAVNYKTDPAGANKTCENILTAGGNAKSFQSDIGKKHDFEGLVEEVYQHFGRLDILVNNAARTRFGPLWDMTEIDFNDVIDTVLRGPFFGSIAAAKKMQDHGGSIINISSIAVKQIMEGHSVYTMAKGGLESLTRQLALELSPKVRVNALAPTATSNERNLAYDPDYDKKWANVSPIGRIAYVNDYVGPCVFLASEDSALVTGQIIYVDGGWTLQGNSPDASDFDFSSDRQKS